MTKKHPETNAGDRFGRSESAAVLDGRQNSHTNMNFQKYC